MEESVLHHVRDGQELKFLPEGLTDLRESASHHNLKHFCMLNVAINIDRLIEYVILIKLVALAFHEGKARWGAKHSPL